MSARYALVNEWLLCAPPDRIFDALATPQSWPRWWRYVESVTNRAHGDGQGIGAVWRYTWTSRLPYRLTIDMTTTRSTRPSLIEATAAGDLIGAGRWTLTRAGAASRVRCEWNVDTTRRWMNALAPLLAPAFAWNHDQVMAAGGRGLARHLGVTLLACHRVTTTEDRRCTTC